MSKARNRRERRRVSPEMVKKDAASGGKQQIEFFNLPDGVKLWQPPKAGTYDIDILPYEVKVANHPNRIGVDFIWYKRPFKIHRGIGANKLSLVCPTSVGSPCPICSYRDTLDKNTQEKLKKELKPQNWVVYNRDDPTGKNEQTLFAFSYGKFAQQLDKELTLFDKDDPKCNFYEVVKTGHTITARFVDAVFDGNKYLTADRIDFKPRKDMHEDTILDNVVCLDTIFNILSHKEIEALFFEIDPPDDEEKLETEETIDQDDDDSVVEPESEPGIIEPEQTEEGDGERPIIGESVEVTIKGEDIEGVVYSVNDIQKTAKITIPGKNSPVKVRWNQITILLNDDPQESAGKEAIDTPQTQKCPLNGKTFGVNTDDPDILEACEKCKIWDECDTVKNGA